MHIKFYHFRYFSNVANMIIAHGHFSQIHTHIYLSTASFSLRCFCLLHKALWYVKTLISGIPKPFKQSCILDISHVYLSIANFSSNFSSKIQPYCLITKNDAFCFSKCHDLSSLEGDIHIISAMIDITLGLKNRHVNLKIMHQLYIVI